MVVIKMHMEIKVIGKNEKGREIKEITLWNTFQDYYGDCKNKRDLYILDWGEDYKLKVEELKFLQKFVQSNCHIDRLKQFIYYYGERDMEARKDSRRYELWDKILDSVNKYYLNEVSESESPNNLKNVQTKKEKIWPSN